MFKSKCLSTWNISTIRSKFSNQVYKSSVFLRLVTQQFFYHYHKTRISVGFNFSSAPSNDLVLKLPLLFQFNLRWTAGLMPEGLVPLPVRCRCLRPHEYVDGSYVVLLQLVLSPCTTGEDLVTPPWLQLVSTCDWSDFEHGLAGLGEAMIMACVLCRRNVFVHLVCALAYLSLHRLRGFLGFSLGGCLVWICPVEAELVMGVLLSIGVLLKFIKAIL